MLVDTGLLLATALAAGVSLTCRLSSKIDQPRGFVCGSSADLLALSLSSPSIDQPRGRLSTELLAAAELRPTAEIGVRDGVVLYLLVLLESASSDSTEEVPLRLRLNRMAASDSDDDERSAGLVTSSANASNPGGQIGSVRRVGLLMVDGWEDRWMGMDGGSG